VSINPCRAKKSKKLFLFLLYILLLLLFGIKKHFEKNTSFWTFIEGIISDGRCKGASTLPMRNRLSNPKSGFL